MEQMIKVNHIKHCFGEKTVLKDICFEIGRGEIFGLLGPSGAGKTTIIKILTGQLVASDGEATILGKKSAGLSGEDYRDIGIMMDNFGLYERMSCYDNLKLFCKIYSVPVSKIDIVLEKVGLKEASKKVVSDLSKGMRSRMLLARAILNNPKVLFLDEPTSGLDPKTTEEIHKLILELKENGTTIFLTTHNMTEAEKLCENIALLNEGKIIEFGNPGEICRKYNHQKQLLIHLYDGSDLALGHKGKDLEKVKQYLESNQIETIHSTESNLETVFIELTGRKLD